MQEWSRLLPVQFAAWDQDRRHPQGDLLVAYGFVRVPPPSAAAGSARYEFRISARAAVALWDFGFLYSRCGRGAVCLDRQEAAALYCPEAGLPDGAWTREAVLRRASRTAPAPLYLTKRAIEWISRYEAWRLAQFGFEHRPPTQVSALQSSPRGVSADASARTL